MDLLVIAQILAGPCVVVAWGLLNRQLQASADAGAKQHERIEQEVRDLKHSVEQLTEKVIALGSDLYRNYPTKNDVATMLETKRPH